MSIKYRQRVLFCRLRRRRRLPAVSKSFKYKSSLMVNSLAIKDTNLMETVQELLLQVNELNLTYERIGWNK